MLPTALLALCWSLAGQPGKETDGPPPLKVGTTVVFIPGTYRKSEIRYEGADPRVRFTVEDAKEFRPLEDSAIRPVTLTRKTPRYRLPSGYLTTAVPIFTAGRLLELKPPGSELRNLTAVARVEIRGGDLDGKKVWVRQSALAPQRGSLDHSLKRGFADWARAVREAEEAAGKLPAGNRLRRIRGRVKEVEQAIRSDRDFQDADVKVFLTRAIEDRWFTYSAEDFTAAAARLRPPTDGP